MATPGWVRHSTDTASAPFGPVGHEELYSYTAGRWLWNETEQLTKRYRKFDEDALNRAATAAVGSASCVEIVKLVEGNFNKVFLLRMDDGKEVVAKLPNPNAGRPHLLTASEAATMEYVRDVLGIPAPRILSWCSDARETAVGAEYILMENAPGRPLSEFWPSLRGKQRAKIVQQLAGFDSKLSEHKFPSYGSLYFKTTPLPDSKVLSERFVIGPTTERTWFDDRRAEVDVDCGPWHAPERYFNAVIDREEACIRKFGNSGRQQGLQNPGIASLFTPTASQKLALLSQCRLLPGALLASKKLDCSSSLWHPDLHDDNIFVDPIDPAKITAVIDWQAVHLKPLFLQVRNPSLLNVDEPLPEGLQLPTLPDNFDTMTEDEQLEARRICDSKLLLRIWEIVLCRNVPDAYHALQTRGTLRAQILGIMGSVFDDGDPALEGFLIALQDQWDAITLEKNGKHVPCPLRFSDDDRTRQAEDMEKWQRGVELKHEISQYLGVDLGWDGAVAHARYDDMKDRIARARCDFLEKNASSEAERLDWEKAWPFTPTGM